MQIRIASKKHCWEYKKIGCGQLKLFLANGEFSVNLEDKYLTIAGIDGSYWATPTLVLIFQDGTEQTIDCYKNKE